VRKRPFISKYLSPELISLIRPVIQPSDRLFWPLRHFDCYRRSTSGMHPQE
jgi:hypothetical protein